MFLDNVGKLITENFESILRTQRSTKRNCEGEKELLLLQIKELKESHSKNEQNLRSQYEDTLAQEQIKFAQQIEESKASNQEQVQSLTKHYEAILAQNQTKFDRQIDELMSLHQEQEQQIRNRYDAIIALDQIKFKTRLEEFEESRFEFEFKQKQQVIGLEKIIEDLNQYLNQKEKFISQLSDRTEELKEQLNQNRDIIGGLKQKVVELENNFNQSSIVNLGFDDDARQDVIVRDTVLPGPMDCLVEIMQSPIESSQIFATPLRRKLPKKKSNNRGTYRNLSRTVNEGKKYIKNLGGVKQYFSCDAYRLRSRTYQYVDSVTLSPYKITKPLYSPNLFSAEFMGNPIAREEALTPASNKRKRFTLSNSPQKRRKLF